MPNYSCKECNFETTNLKNFNKHIKTNKHINNTTLSCINCNYFTQNKYDYKKHLTTQKHLININKNNLNNKEEIIMTVKEEFTKQNEEVKKKTEELLNEIQKLKETNEKLKETNDKNTNKIVKEARSIKQSILTMLNANFKDTPSIEYIEKEPFIDELEKEYKAEIDDSSNKLFMRIFSDYEKKKLIKTLSDLILKFVKKDQQKFQSVFNIDAARYNFATKIDDFWMNDKKGLQLRKFTIDKVVDFMIDILEVFRMRLVKIREENIRNPQIQRSDFLMKSQTSLFDVVSFLNNPNTHMKIICELSPNLRCNEKLLELYIN